LEIGVPKIDPKLLGKEVARFRQESTRVVVLEVVHN